MGKTSERVLVTIVVIAIVVVMFSIFAPITVNAWNNEVITPLQNAFN